ncbi:MAG TPA: hypothetical protein VHG91_06375 [Longimicrobium sp.]|nr:hypothetical protein [Longimicrobium sp.]
MKTIRVLAAAAALGLAACGGGGEEASHDAAPVPSMADSTAAMPEAPTSAP